MSCRRTRISNCSLNFTHLRIRTRRPWSGSNAPRSTASRTAGCAVARAFLHRPKLLLLDEPFTSLDDRAIALLQSLLRDSLREGGTVIMSTHQLREAMDLATHVVLLNRGRKAHAGERTPEMLADTGWLYRNYGDE